MATSSYSTIPLGSRMTCGASREGPKVVPKPAHTETGSQMASYGRHRSLEGSSVARPLTHTLVKFSVPS